MNMPKIVLISALVSCALLSGCKDDKPSAVTIEFMHSSVEQERQAVITKLIFLFRLGNPLPACLGNRLQSVRALMTDFD